MTNSDGSLLLEIHIPLVAGFGIPADEDQFAWITEIDDYLADLDDTTNVAVDDDGTESGDEYLFFLAGDDEDELIAVANRVADLPGVPAGAFGLLRTADSQAAAATRVDLKG